MCKMELTTPFPFLILILQLLVSSVTRVEGDPYLVIRPTSTLSLDQVDVKIPAGT